MYAIIRDRGKQYKVSEGAVLDLDLLPDSKDGDALQFDEVLMTSNGEGEVTLGTPKVEGVQVAAKVVEALVKGAKIDVVHFRRRKDSMTKQGHRQRYTRVKIETIGKAE